MSDKNCVFSEMIKVSSCECSVPGDIIYSKTILTENREKKQVLDEIVSLLQQRFHKAFENSFRFRLCLDEGIQNAFSHGNNDDPDKQVQIIVFETEQKWGIVIKDEGDGFNTDSLIDPTSSEGMWRECGRGLLIMHKYMDEMIYFNGGRTLKLVKAK